MSKQSLERVTRDYRAGRLADYLGEMFPPAVHVPAGVALFGGTYLALQALGANEPLVVPWRAWFGAATIVLTMLLLRVYDELKDVDTDLQLGRDGDPRYKDRAIVTGRVTVEDLVALKQGLVATLIALNLPLGTPWPLAGFALLLGVVWLSSRWFFWPAVSRDLLLAFVTHNPMVLVMGAYILALYVHDFGAEGLSAGVVWLGLAIWLPMAAWETSRKLRPPGAETDYQTYSKRLGWRVAGALPALFTLGATAAILIVAHRAELSWVFRAAVLGGAAVLVGGCLRFLIRPSTSSAKLQPLAEVFVLLSTVGLAVAAALRYGISLSGP
jgi:hypothetical protein